VDLGRVQVLEASAGQQAGHRGAHTEDTGNATGTGQPLGQLGEATLNHREPVHQRVGLEEEEEDGEEEAGRELRKVSKNLFFLLRVLF
jgi:hypothetical protein